MMFTDARHVSVVSFLSVFFFKFLWHLLLMMYVEAHLIITSPVFTHPKKVAGHLHSVPYYPRPHSDNQENVCFVSFCLCFIFLFLSNFVLLFMYSFPICQSSCVLYLCNVSCMTTPLNSNKSTQAEFLAAYF